MKRPENLQRTLENLSAEKLYSTLSSKEGRGKKQHFQSLFKITFLSVCAGGNKALERSAIFWKGNRGTERVKLISESIGLMHTSVSESDLLIHCPKVCFYWWKQWTSVPSVDLHTAAQTLRVQSLAWWDAGGLAVKQSKTGFRQMKYNMIVSLWQWVNVGRTYPWGPTDDVGQLFDEMAGGGDDFIGLLLSGVSTWKRKMEDGEKYSSETRYFSNKETPRALDVYKEMPSNYCGKVNVDYPGRFHQRSG